jgi:electron transport complex protein RnfC
MFQKSLFKGGASVSHRKNTEESETKVLQIPDRIVIPMVQHIGVPCQPTVKKGEEVKVGQVIGASD